MTTPLRPEFKVTETAMSASVCNCCGDPRDDHDVKDVHFNWREPGHLHARELRGGGTRIALCHVCRKRAAAVLLESL